MRVLNDCATGGQGAVLCDGTQRREGFLGSACKRRKTNNQAAEISQGQCRWTVFHPDVRSDDGRARFHCVYGTAMQGRGDRDLGRRGREVAQTCPTTLALALLTRRRAPQQGSGISLSDYTIFLFFLYA